MSDRIRIGMIGGGPDAFIGAVHRMALRLDGQFELVAGAFSASASRSAITGAELGLDPQRVYGSWQEMAQAEAALPAAQRLQAVAIVTPNFLHHEPAIEFLNRGFHVICDKPMSINSACAAAMQAAVERSGKVFALTHNYSGYPMVHEARKFVQSGALGDLRKVYVEYLQGWLGDAIENDGQKQAVWRTDPQKTGPGGSLGDIGTHAFHLLEHISVDRVTQLYGRRHNFVAGRQVDDDAMLLLEMNSGATGTLVVSQVCAGAENNLRIRIHGSEGGLLWEHENPNELQVFHKQGAREIRRVGSAYLHPEAQSLSRVPSGHPEGYVEAFANIYQAFARAIRNDSPTTGSNQGDFPSVFDGCRGVRFIEAAIESSATGQWVALSE
jgi:predicted dehydrogenase